MGVEPSAGPSTSPLLLLTVEEAVLFVDEVEFRSVDDGAVVLGICSVSVTPFRNRRKNPAELPNKSFSFEN